MAKQRYDVCAKVGEYEDKFGATKGRWLKLGVAFVNDNGSISVNLDAVPSPTEKGWQLVLFPPRDQAKGGAGYDPDLR